MKRRDNEPLALTCKKCGESKPTEEFAFLNEGTFSGL